MTSLANCWEVMGCGREPGGAHAADEGVCPAAAEVIYQGVNGGLNAGRFCWTVAGTLCGGQTQGTFAQKALNCMECPFYAQVVHELPRDQLILNPSQLF